MNTPPPDKQPAAETLEEIAERIAKQHAPTFYQGALSRDILSALRNERERCAKVAEVIPESKFDLDHEPARTEQQIRAGIAAAIRKGR